MFVYTVPMGGERSSTVRMREAGKICAICNGPLHPPDTPGEKRCPKCGGNHRVYMSFMAREAWFCHFLEEDLKTPLPRKLAFADRDKVLELARRGGATMDLEARQALSHAFEIGRGGVWLNLTEEQYRKLRKSGTILSRQFFFAVGKPHRPTDAKLTGEAAGRYWHPKTDHAFSKSASSPA